MKRTLFSLILVFSLSSFAQPPFGIAFRQLEHSKEAALAPCPSTPNCVTSFRHPSQSKQQTMPALTGNNAQDSLAKIKLIALREGGKIVQETQNYLRIQFTNKYLALTDDTEFYFPNERTIHFRSASALNLYTDLGSNHRRIKRIADQL